MNSYRNIHVYRKTAWDPELKLIIQNRKTITFALRKILFAPLINDHRITNPFLALNMAYTKFIRERYRLA